MIRDIELIDCGKASKETRMVSNPVRADGIIIIRPTEN